MCKDGKIDVMEYLIKHGAQIDIQNNVSGEFQ